MGLWLVFLLLLLRAESWGYSPDVFLRASAATGIPVELILAVSHVESSFHPHALNISGRSVYPSSRAEAERILERSGDSVDIGLMQISWRYWGDKLGVSKSELLDPRTNVLLGARILQDCVRTTGDLWQGVGHYHSRTPRRQRRYIEKVRRSYRRVLAKLRE